MSKENPLWGAPRIHGELRKLGFELAQSTVSKYMVRGRTPPAQSWKTFLRNQADGIAAIDLCVVPTLTFERLFAFVVLGHARRRLLWFAVTRQPTAEWLAQQITEAFPWDSAPAYLVRDNDGAYEKSSGVASDRWGSATDRVTGEGVNPLIRTHLSPSGRGKTPLGPHMRLPCGSPGASLSVWPLGTFQPVIR